MESARKTLTKSHRAFRGGGGNDGGRCAHARARALALASLVVSLVVVVALWDLDERRALARAYKQRRRFDCLRGSAFRRLTADKNRERARLRGDERDGGSGGGGSDDGNLSARDAERRSGARDSSRLRERLQADRRTDVGDRRRNYAIFVRVAAEIAIVKRHVAQHEAGGLLFLRISSQTAVIRRRGALN